MHSSDSLLGIEWLRNEFLNVLCVPGNVGQMRISTRDLSSNCTYLYSLGPHTSTPGPRIWNSNAQIFRRLSKGEHPQASTYWRGPKGEDPKTRTRKRELY